MVSKFVLLAAALAASASAASPAALYGQCGGKQWTGATSCASGSTCKYQNDYYSQCLPGGNAGGSQPQEPKTTAAAAPHSTAKTSPTAAQATSPASTGLASGSGKSFKSSFTAYGSGDQNGSPNCNTATTACGFYTSPGYSAAVSQNEFGVGPGAGAGPACGTCWRLTVETTESGAAISNAGNSIVVQVTNLCPASGNPLCAQSSLTSTNQYGANVNFDTCLDSGASAKLFGNSGTELAIGTATEVDCSEWSGTVVH